MATQFDLTPQSPQPSHTAGLMKDALDRIGEGAALAAAALLGCARLVVDEGRDAVDQAQVLLHLLQIAAVIDRRAGRQEALRILLGLVSDDDELLDAFGQDLGRHLADRQAAVQRLAAGHGDGVVVEQLVGDVDAGRHRGADRQAAGVDVGAVAEVLEHVTAARERRFPDPVGALAAHVRPALGGAVHPLRHVVAADAGVGARAFGHNGR